MDDDFAREHGFTSKVMHGSILNGFVSHFVGVHLPGRRALLHSVALEYRTPSFMGDRILLRARIKQKVESLRVVVLDCELRNLTHDRLSAKGKIQVGFTS